MEHSDRIEGRESRRDNDLFRISKKSMSLLTFITVII